METLTRAIMAAGLQQQVLNEQQLARVTDGTPQRRYSLVNRAIHKGELLRLRRGLYIVEPSISGQSWHPYVLAASLVPGSYVSLQSALSYHGWIPESVPMHLAITPDRRRKQVTTPGFGDFRFYPLAIRTGRFLTDVERVVINGHPALVASPVRALLDFFCLHKKEWESVDSLVLGLRIDDAQLAQLQASELEPLRPVYQHQRMQRVIHGFQRALTA